MEIDASSLDKVKPKVVSFPRKCRGPGQSGNRITMGRVSFFGCLDGR